MEALFQFGVGPRQAAGGPDGGRLTVDDGGTGDRRPETEDRRPKTEDRRPKTEDRRWTSRGPLRVDSFFRPRSSVSGPALRTRTFESSGTIRLTPAPSPPRQSRGSSIACCFWYLPFLSAYEIRQGSSAWKNSTWAIPSPA